MDFDRTNCKIKYEIFLFKNDIENEDAEDLMYDYEEGILYPKESVELVDRAQEAYPDEIITTHSPFRKNPYNESSRYEDIKFEKLEPLIGETIYKISKTNTELLFITDHRSFYFYDLEEGTGNDCRVEIDDIVGDLDDLIGTPLVKAEVRYNNDETKEGTWTFYHFATQKGYVDIKWFGVSNGYYSEMCRFDILPLNDSASPFYSLYQIIKDDYENLKDLFWEYDIIQEGKIIKDRLNEFLQDIGKPEVGKIEWSEGGMKYLLYFKN